MRKLIAQYMEQVIQTTLESFSDKPGVVATKAPPLVNKGKGVKAINRSQYHRRTK